MELENKEIINFAERNNFKASPLVLDTVINQNSLGGGADWLENNPEAKSYIKNRTHWKEHEDRILIEDEEVVFTPMPDEDWEKESEESRYITCYLSFSATEIDFRYSDFEIAVDGVICYTEEKERSSGQIKLGVLLPTEEMVQVNIYKVPCGGGYGINIDRYNNLSGNFTITIKEKIPIYFPIDDNYLVSKLSVFTVELDDSDIINVPLNFRNGIIFCVTKKNPNNYHCASIYTIHFGSDVYNDPPRPLFSLSDGKIIESTSVLFPTCALIYVDGNRTCYLINPLQDASSTT